VIRILVRSIFSPHEFLHYPNYFCAKVMQISGSKLWSVATESAVYLSTRDLKRKPTIQEMNRYLAEGGRYRDFLLRPGDVLYIPRGFIHNASTVGPNAGLVDTHLSGINDVHDDGDDNTWLQPSLHLTFGIEHTCETTYEALLQHAMHLYGKTDAGKIVAISGEACGTEQDILWHHMLALTISDVSRRGCGGESEGFDEFPPYLDESWSGFCATSSNSDVETGTHLLSKDGLKRNACVLRRSVPRGKFLKKNLSFHLRDGCRSDQEDGSKTCSGNDHILMNYSASLNAVQTLASPRALSWFLHHLRKMANSGSLDTFCIPLLRDWNALGCSQEALDRLVADEMRGALRNFTQFAEKNFAQILRQFESHLGENRHKDLHRDDNDLRAVGELQSE